MARDGQRQVVGVNSLAVVRDADELGAPVDDLDIDAGGQGIEAVLQEFLDDAARAFDDFTGGNLIDDEGLERLNPRHKTGRERDPVQCGPANCAGGMGNPCSAAAAGGTPCAECESNFD